jgi:hypothetical protein
MLLAFSFIGLVVWVVIDTILGQARWLVKGISSLVTPMFNYMLNIYSLVKTGIPEAKEKLIKLTGEITELLSNAISGLNKDKVYKILYEKIDAYENKDMEKIIKLNNELSIVISKGNAVLSEVILAILNDMDNFLVVLEEQISSTDIYNKARDVTENILNILK